MAATRRFAVAIGAAALVAVAGCGRDDGAGVRVIGTPTGSPTATASGTATGTGTTATGTGAPSCEPVGAGLTPGSEIDVTLEEYSIAVDTRRVAAGAVEFDIDNRGTEPHELVVVAAAGPGALPTTEDGALDEQALGRGRLVGEVHPFEAGEDCHGTFTLDPGRYVLLCNVVESHDGDAEAHFAEGMHTVIEVRG